MGVRGGLYDVGVDRDLDGGAAAAVVWPTRVGTELSEGTRYLPIEIDHKVPQLTGSGPLYASSALALPQLLGHRTSLVRCPVQSKVARALPSELGFAG